MSSDQALIKTHELRSSTDQDLRAPIYLSVGLSVWVCLCVSVFVYLCVDVFVCGCGCGCGCVCLCASEEKEDEERKTEFVGHTKKREEKRCEWKLIK